MICYYYYSYLFFYFLNYLFTFGCTGSSLLFAQTFASWGQQGLLFLGVRRLLVSGASLAVERRLSGHTGSIVGVHRLSLPAARGIFPDQGRKPRLLR